MSTIATETTTVAPLRECRKCRTRQPLTEFSRIASGHRYVCRTCRRAPKSEAYANQLATNPHIAEMLRSGWKPPALANHMGVGESRVYRAACKYGVRLDRAKGIANEYRVEGDVTYIVLRSKTHGVKETAISTADLPVACDVDGLWNAAYDKRHDTFYVHGKRGNRLVVLHRAITGALKGEEVDHINHDGLCNTRSNLRRVSTSTNQLNRKGATSRSETGVLGVCKSSLNTWKAQIRVAGKEHYLGSFGSIDSAAAALADFRERNGLPCQPR